MRLEVHVHADIPILEGVSKRQLEQAFAPLLEYLDADGLSDVKSLEPDEPGIKQVFINAHIKSLNGEEWAYNEGCLSIPKIREDISRNETVVLEYLDENFEKHEETFRGVTARIILHEYDHIEGKLFIDYLKPLKRKLLKGKLEDISKGKVKVDYKMVFIK